VGAGGGCLSGGLEEITEAGSTPRGMNEDERVGGAGGGPKFFSGEDKFGLGKVLLPDMCCCLGAKVLSDGAVDPKCTMESIVGCAGGDGNGSFCIVLPTEGVRFGTGIGTLALVVGFLAGGGGGGAPPLLTPLPGGAGGGDDGRSDDSDEISGVNCGKTCTLDGNATLCLD